MEKNENTSLQGNQKVQGVWERRTGDRRWGQNQLFGSFRVDSAVRKVVQSDPTENVLAAIASILDQLKEMPAPKAVDQPQPASTGEEAVVAAPQPAPSATADVDADGYLRLGPGPLDAIRFKWKARPAGDGCYFVDETVGENSQAMTSGPMPKHEAIRFIDERERDARARFEAIKYEMTGQRRYRNDTGER